MKRNPVHSTGALSTFYHFRRFLSSEAAHRAVKEFVAQAPTHYGPNPLCMETRKYLVKHYDRTVQPLSTEL